ncbi:MAG: PAS domain S-box protein [Cyclobacteriaceae bacterium]
MSQSVKTSLSITEIEAYKAICSAFQDAIVVTDLQGFIVLVNKKAEEIFGFDAGEMIGYSVENLFPEELSNKQLESGHDYINNLIGECKSGESAESSVVTACRKNNKEIFVNINSNLVKIGEQDLIVSFIKDVTISENLELRFHKMVGEIQDYSIVFLDAKGEITNWNKGVERILGYSEKEIISKKWGIFFSEEEQNGVVPEMLLEKASLNGRAEHEGWLMRKDGSLFWASLILTAIYNNSGRVLGFSKVTRDLTERKRSEEMVRSQAEELQLKNKELENFTYIASHDLQEPLSTVTSMVELIRDESDFKFSEDTEEYFSFIEEAVSRMRNLIKGLLKYSRLGRNRELVNVNLQELIEDVQQDLSNRIKAEGAIIEVMDPLPEIKGFPVELRLLFQNIIGNALKFISPKRKPQIRIFASEFNNYWKFAIEDNGIGIKENYLSKIFVIFQRLHDKSLYEGDGIGLAHCKKIVDIHEGTIWAESAFGSGATFHFTISKNIKSTAEADKASMVFVN